MELPHGDGDAQDRASHRRRLHDGGQTGTADPLSMLALAGILEESGLPGGVLNVVTSSSSGGTMGPLIADPRARKLSLRARPR